MFKRLRSLDWALIAVPLLLLFFGVAVIYTITFPTVAFVLTRSQLIYAALAIIAAVIVTLVDYRRWQSLSPLLYVAGILLLLAVFVIGSRQFGASRWIDLGSFHLQPSELVKLILIIVLARLMAAWSEGITLARLVAVLVIALVPIVLVLKQPDLGTASVLIVITFGMLVYTKIPWKWWLTMGMLVIILSPFAYGQLREYQQDRIKTFFSPNNDLSGQGYNVRQAAIAIGSGRFFGQGLGQGSQSQLNFLPVAHTDFIFSGLAEATGFVGSLILLTLYWLLIYRAVVIAEIAKDLFGSYLAVGIAIMIAFQVIVNVGMNIGLLPVTGIPLPFVSFGGTSLILSFSALGILQSVYSRHKKITFTS